MTADGVRLNLSDDLAMEAASQGLLEPDAIAGLVRVELRRRRTDGLFAAADRLAALDSPPTEAEIVAEIGAAREARRAADSRRT